MTKSAAELSQVGNDMLLVQKFQHPCPSGDTCQGPDLDHIYNVAVDVEVKSFDFASTIYHMFAWSE